MEKTRALCAVTSEVDTESEIWYRLQKDVSDITESVELAVNESLNTAENVAISCSENSKPYLYGTLLWTKANS